jgi:hypothetical protein
MMNPKRFGRKWSGVIEIFFWHLPEGSEEGHNETYSVGHINDAPARARVQEPRDVKCKQPRQTLQPVPQIAVQNFLHWHTARIYSLFILSPSFYFSLN